MKRSRMLLAPLLVLAVAAGCSQPAPQADTPGDIAAINDVRNREMTLVTGGDVDKLLAVYTSDVVVMPPNEPVIRGHDAVRKWGEATFGQVGMTGQYTNSDVTVAGDWAVDRYTGVLRVTPKGGGDTVEEQIKGIHIMKRQSDGSWLIAEDIWNTDSQPPTPSPAAQ